MPNPLAGSRFYARLGNLFTRPLWRLTRPPKGFAVLTTIGRKSGLPRSQSVRAIREGDSVVVVAMMGQQAQWLKNIRADPTVTICLHEGDFRGRAREAAAGAETQWASNAYVGTIVPNDYLDYAVYCWGIPTRRKIEAAHQRWFQKGMPVIINLNAPRDADDRTFEGHWPKQKSN
jgi:deazaflavin-dependent oxidoreductase (nitroreductase family)